MPPGLGRDDSGNLTRKIWLLATSLGSNVTMSLALEAVRKRRGAAEAFAGFVFFGVPHRGSRMVTTFTPSFVITGAGRRMSQVSQQIQPAEGSLLVLYGKYSLLFAGQC